MNAEASLHVLGMGMVCPVGLTLRRARAAMRAGISRRCELPYHDDRSRPIVGSHLDRLPFELSHVERILGLALPAARQALALVPQEQWKRIPVLLVVGDDLGETRSAHLLGQLLDRLGGGWSPNMARVVPGGSFGGIHALAIARATFRQGQADACLVCAADSLIHAAAIQTLEREGRLLGEDNSDGVTPGEAGVSVLLHAYERHALARVRGLGLATEGGLPTNDVPLRGDGIVSAARAALAEAGLGLHDIDLRISDAAGESYYFKEQVLLVSRLLRQRKETLPLLLGALQLGHTGAAAGLVGIVCAIEDVQRGHAPATRALAFAGAPDGRRGAALIEIEKR